MDTNYIFYCRYAYEFVVVVKKTKAHAEPGRVQAEDFGNSA